MENGRISLYVNAVGGSIFGGHLQAYECGSTRAIVPGDNCHPLPNGIQLAQSKRWPHPADRLDESGA